MSLLKFSPKGIYCPRADVYIDPWRPVDRAIISHGHADHAKWGMKHYLCHHLTVPILKLRIGSDISVEGKAFGEQFIINGVTFSLHPAGHIIGSAQVRVEYKGEVWVFSGDYKTQHDPYLNAFEPIKCDTFITESTFGLPIYKWKPFISLNTEMNNWWSKNKDEGKISIISGYSLGKAQRLICGLDTSIGKIFTHGAVENMNEVLRYDGNLIPNCTRITRDTLPSEFEGGMVIAPPSALFSSWVNKFKPHSKAVASGWMALRGARRRRNADKGFVVSDHADWEGLNEAVMATGAENVFVTHGYTDIFAEWLRSKGLNAKPVVTEYEGELSEIGESANKDEEPEQAVA